MCTAQAAEVLLALVVVAVWPGGWPIDPIIALGVAGYVPVSTGPDSRSRSLPEDQASRRRSRCPQVMSHQQHRLPKPMATVQQRE
jgi:hypothetical protein